MDAKRFTEINGNEALKKLIQDESIFNAAGQKYYIKNSKLVRDYTNIGALDSGLTIEEILIGTWYIKKPFDVRAEMLAKPDKWIGAFQDGLGFWHKVGFDLNQMEVRVASLLSDKLPYQVPSTCNLDELNRCIPIDEAIEEVM